MGLFNPRTPSIEGSEFQPTTSRRVNLNSPLKGIAMRIRPSSSGSVTISRLHPLLRLVEGNPGLALEVLTTLEPTIAETVFLPGTDTGNTVTGWQDQAGATLNYSDVDAEYFDGTNYARNSAAVSATGALTLAFRGNNAGALGTNRVLSVRVGAVLRLLAATGNAREVDVAARLVLNGQGYLAAAKRTGQRASWDRRPNLGRWWLNPETGIPWTVSEVDDIIDSADGDTFGIRARGKLAATGLRVGGLFLTVEHCAENRIGSVYTAGAVRAGWLEQVLAATASIAANTFCWVHLYALNGSTEDYLQTTILNDPALLVDDVAAGTGDCRMVVRTTLSGPGGVPVETVEKPGQMFPILIEVGGTIQPSSQPYVQLEDGEIFLNRATVTPYNAQQITTPNPTATFAGVQFAAGWEDLRRRPDRPLKIEVRTGAGAATGGGTLKATATLSPEDSTAALAQRLVAFDAAFAAATSTQHHVLFYSRATPGRGWKLNAVDTRSDLVTSGGGTTVAEVEGASQGGQTDSYTTGGTPLDRYDIPVAMFAAPSGPSGLTATVVEGEGLLRPPKVRLTWSATSLGSAFAAYRIWRRPARAQAVPWELLGRIKPGDDDTPADVEAQQCAFDDREATWASADWCAPGPGDHGWDYAVTTRNTDTGLESAIPTSMVTDVVVPAGDAVWLTSNAAPWLNAPLDLAWRLDVEAEDRTRVFEVAGRDGAVTRTRAEAPARVWRLGWRQQGFVAGDVLRVHQAAARSGRRLALLTTRGDRGLGALTFPGEGHGAENLFDVDAHLVENGAQSAVAGFNLPAGLVLNGSTQYISTPDAADLDPGSSAFSVVVALVRPAWASAKTSFGKGNPGVGVGWGMGTTLTTNQVGFAVQGSTTLAQVTNTDPAWFDGTMHVAIGTTTGTAQKLYRDGALVASAATTHGPVSNSTAMVAGAANGGASGHSALNPIHAWALYTRALTDDEVLAAARYLAGDHGHRMPAGPVAFYHLADDRCWDGVATTLTDLSGNGHDATIVGAPTPRGAPWPLDETETW